MKTPERFNRAIKAWVTSFFDASLVKGHCKACAIGQVVAAGYGKKVTIDEDGDPHCEVINDEWRWLFYNTKAVPSTWSSLYPESLDNIAITGYSVNEMAKVEFSFEINTDIHFKDYPDHTKKQIMEDQYKGLMAVVEVLCDIEGLNADEYKSMFEYTDTLKPVEL